MAAKKVKTPEVDVNAILEENEMIKEKTLRMAAELQNYMRRNETEKQNFLKYDGEEFIKRILPIVDDFERAIKHNQNIEDVTVLKEGFTLIYNKLMALLKRFEVEEIIAIGEIFDTDLHEAVTHLPAQCEEDKEKIMDVTEKGYKLKDKVIRFSKVVVAN